MNWYKDQRERVTTYKPVQPDIPTNHMCAECDTPPAPGSELGAEMFTDLQHQATVVSVSVTVLLLLTFVAFVCYKRKS
jgi:hypothetical protein